MERVVPLRQRLMVFDREVVHLSLLDLDPLGVALADEVCPDAKAGGRGGASEVLEDGLVAVQGSAGPVLADLAEEPVLDGIPLGGSGRGVRDGEGEWVGGGQRGVEG